MTFKRPTCKDCGDPVEPDLMYLSLSGQDWSRWMHSPPKVQRACDLDEPGVRAEPEDVHAARDYWTSR